MHSVTINLTPAWCGESESFLHIQICFVYSSWLWTCTRHSLNLKIVWCLLSTSPPFLSNGKKRSFWNRQNVWVLSLWGGVLSQGGLRGRDGTSHVPVTPGDHVPGKEAKLVMQVRDLMNSKEVTTSLFLLTFREPFFCLIFALEQLYFFLLFSKTEKIYLMAIQIGLQDRDVNILYINLLLSSNHFGEAENHEIYVKKSTPFY